MIKGCEDRDEDKRVADNTIKTLRENISELVMWKKQAVDRCVSRPRPPIEPFAAAVVKTLGRRRIARGQGLVGRRLTRGRMCYHGLRL